MLKTWSYTIVLLLMYLAVFQLWHASPSRAMFLTSGATAVALMTGGMVVAARRGYFANRRDLILHAFVIIDVGLEGSIYEIFRATSFWLFGSPGDVTTFHDNHNFFVCAAGFALLVGGYHAWALRARSRRLQEPAANVAGEFSCGS